MLGSLPWYLDLPGWYGTIVFIVTFALNSFKVMDRGYLYLILNCTGGIGACFTAACYAHVQAVVLEAIWAMIAAGALLKLWHDERKKWQKIREYSKRP